MNDTVALGTSLRRRRQSLGMTLESLSNGICSTAYLSLIEQGQRYPSERILDLLETRLHALGSETGLSAQLNALRVAEFQIRHHGIDSVEENVATKPHQLMLDALEHERRGEWATAVGQVAVWLKENENSRDLVLFGARIKLRLLRELGYDAEALRFASQILAGPKPTIRNRQSDLLDIAFQTASLYASAGAWRDAQMVVEQHRELIAEPRDLVNSLWAASSASFAKGDLGAALAETQEALRAALELDTPVLHAKLAGNSVWFELMANEGDAVEQAKVLDDAIEKLRKANSAPNLSNTYSVYALLHARQGNVPGFLEAASQALTMSLDHNTRNHDQLLVTLAEVALSCGQDEYALDCLNQLDARTRKISAGRAEAIIVQRASQIAQRLGHTERALKYLEESQRLLGFVNLAP